MARINLKNSKKKEKSTTSRVAKYSGLCSTCNNAPDCCLIGSTDQPVIFCEEFNIHQQTQVRTMDDTALQAVDFQSIITQKPKEPSKYQGLCVNCDDRETCTFLKPEGGAWYCEEYR